MWQKQKYMHSCQVTGVEAYKGGRQMDCWNQQETTRTTQVNVSEKSQNGFSGTDAATYNLTGVGIPSDSTIA
jgi:hypothetical protein